MDGMVGGIEASMVCFDRMAKIYMRKMVDCAGLDEGGGE